MSGWRGFKTWSELTPAEKLAIYAKKKDARAAKRAAFVAEGLVGANALFADAYGYDNFKSARARNRAYNNDMRRKGPYARSLATYRPRKNDWPGVDDTGFLNSGEQVETHLYKDRRRRVHPPMLRGPLSARQELFAAAARQRAAAARAMTGGYSKEELYEMAKAMGVQGRSKMKSAQLWLALGQPVVAVPEQMPIDVIAKRGLDDGSAPVVKRARG